MRQETLDTLAKKSHYFINGPVYDMGGGNWQNYDLKSLLHGRDLIVVDFFKHESVQIVDDLQTLTKISDSSVDNIFTSDVLEHIENPWKAVESFHRVLKTNGVVYITVPFIWHCHGHDNDKGEKVDFWRFTPLGLKALLGNLFEVIEYDWDTKAPSHPSDSLWRCGCHIIAKKIENPNKSNNSNENWSMSKINTETGGW